MIQSASLPPALVSRLAKQEKEVSLSLATPLPALDSKQPAKDLADRTLLSLTPKALSTLDEAMDSGLTKDRIQAAKEVLDRSPATKPTLLESGTALPQLPPEAVTSLFSGLSRLFQGIGAAASAASAPEPIPSAQDQEVSR
jgi:hypothetical protein